MSIESFAGDVLDREHPEYEKVRPGWNGMIDRRPALIARCSSVEDVVAAVRHAAANGLTAVARCGGHSVSGASLPEDGLLVDLGGLKAISVDPEKRIAHVGGGVLLGEMDAATQEHGLAVTAGVEPETGVAGLTLGGGIGFLVRKLGLTIDSMIGAQVVLADGTVVEAGPENHPDLFWALRGGGGQFGIVTRFDFRVHPIGPDVVVAQAFYPIDKAREVMHFVSEYMRGAPDDVTMLPVFTTVPPVEPFPAEWQGRYAVAAIACHVGDIEAAKADLRPVLEQGDMISGFVDTVKYVDFQKTFAGAAPHGERFYWKSIFVEDISDELVDLLVDGLKGLPGEYSNIFMETLGGAAGRVGVEETAFANRKARFNLGISAGWSDPARDDEIVGAARALFERLRPFSDGTVYLNYLDRDETARAAEGFGPNYARLVEVKRRYDPENRFGGVLGGAG